MPLEPVAFAQVIIADDGFSVLSGAIVNVLSLPFTQDLALQVLLQLDDVAQEIIGGCAYAVVQLSGAYRGHDNQRHEVVIGSDGEGVSESHRRGGGCRE
ncbi:transcription repressor MYB5 [Sesbania bispinosa]|nr:transcription repressor MYB5 [Sesbania bispinosa]